MIKYFFLPLGVTTNHSPLYLCICISLPMCVQLSTVHSPLSTFIFVTPILLLYCNDCSAEKKEKIRNLCNILSTCVLFPAVFVFVFVFVTGHQCDQVNSDCRVVPSFLTTPFYCTSADVLDLISWESNWNKKTLFGVMRWTHLDFRVFQFKF